MNFLPRLVLVALIGLQPSMLTQEMEPSQAESYFHFLVGSLASLEKEPRVALEHFQYASHLDPKTSTLQLHQAEELLSMGDVDKAKEILEAIGADHQDNSDYHLIVSRVASQELDVDSAVKSLNAALEIFRKEGNDLKVRETVLSKVALLADFKRYEDCVKTLKAYLKKDPSDEIAFYFLGKIHSVFQHRDEAKKAYRMALELRPNFGAASRALGLQLELEGKLTEAMAVYQQAAEFGGNDEELFQKLINLSLILEDYPTALKYLNQYLVMRPDDAQSQLRAGLIHFKLKEYVEARDLFERLLKNADVAEDRVRFYLASVYEELNENQRAVEHYLQVKAPSDYYAESRLQAAILMTKNLNQPDAGVHILQDAAKAKPDNAEIVLALANQYDHLNRVQEGTELLTKASDKFKDHERILFMLGVFQDKSGQWETSIATMRHVLEINPNNPHALNHIGYSFAERNVNLAEAESFLKKAVQLAPDNGFIVDSLGWLYHRMGKYQRAADFLEKANRLSPGQIVILEHLADTYKKLGRDQEALAVYRQIMGWSSNANSETRADLSLPDSDTETKAIQDRVRTKIAGLSSSDQY